MFIVPVLSDDLRAKILLVAKKEGMCKLDGDTLYKEILSCTIEDVEYVVDNNTIFIEGDKDDKRRKRSFK